MSLAPMRYKDYIWPHNPSSYSIAYERRTVFHKVPFGRHFAQDLGMGPRIIRGEGAFAGEGAYGEFRRLASVFYSDGPGLLIHPLWQVSNAYFTSLTLREEPLPDYVRYSFEFRERYDGYSETLTASGGAASGADGAASAGEDTVYTVVAGDTLWGLAKYYGVTLEAILAANPAVRNPNSIHVGDKVVIPS